MAGSGQLPSQTVIPTKSYETALCIVPPQDQCCEIDKLRSLYDKAYEKWPPHINLVYPFVAPEHLVQVKELLQSHLRTAFSDVNPMRAALAGAGIFKHKKDTTIFLQDVNEKESNILSSIRSTVLEALGQKDSPQTFHLTVGQAQDSSVAARQFLVDKVNLLPEFHFDIDALVILVREKTGGKADVVSQMRLWDTIDFSVPHSQPQTRLSEFWIDGTSSANGSPSLNDEVVSVGEPSPGNKRPAQPGITYEFEGEAQEWRKTTAKPDLHRPEVLSVSSYNVLLDSEYPPSHDRYPLLVETLLRRYSLADVLVLQEVSDDFLSYLLGVAEVRKAYPFASHGPPIQADIGPLPSLRNIVVLSKWHFDWENIPFQRRHKGAVVASFPSLFEKENLHNGPLVVVGVHLTAGLTDGAVVAKKMQLQNVVTHLRQTFPRSPWIAAGDFNIPTSKYTLDEAVKQKDISLETAYTLSSTEETLYEHGLLDAWAVARVEDEDETAFLDTERLFEGEEGATFDPTKNPLAAYSSGTSENRPQRYDRIFMRSEGKLALMKFNRFGLPKPTDGGTSVASDHYGIRAVFKLDPNMETKSTADLDVFTLCDVSHRRISPELSITADLLTALCKRAVVPTTEDSDRYREAFGIIKEVLLGSADGEKNQVSDIPMVVVPVGSYALGMWTPESDIDCLCIGSISSKTFFRLARQRILKARPSRMKLLRKVEANTGTMLELSVNGISVDLHYCPAAEVVQRWSKFAALPSSDPAFNLPILSLRKLKPIRDLTYLQRTVPSMETFRTAYRSIKHWAGEQGLYSAKFGYLGGIHITMMLCWVYKRLAHDTGSVRTGDLILSFFHHYANFNWQNDIVYDAFFHKKKPRYQRSAREPMVILGFYAPNSNIAHHATVPSLQVIVGELKRAEERLSVPGTTWESFFEVNTPAVESFLNSFENYVKIDVQYWGRTLSRGKGLLAWIESRCINLVVDIHKALPSLSSRIWPARFADNETNASDSYYHGYYLIGLSRSDRSSPSDKEERAAAKASLQKVFDSFLTQMRADDRNYDEKSGWIDISLAKASDVKDVQLDNREWGDYLPEMDEDSDDEDEVDEPEDEPTLASSQKSLRHDVRSTTSIPVSRNKLRPASDVLNRLRWDAGLDPSAYVVGYEDRFLGAQEASLEKWKTEQTDEEFIPQHRILYFRKKGEDGGEVVWERATRVDKIFGSGRGNGA